MTTTTALALGAVYLLGLLISAALLWLTCRIFRVRYPAESGEPSAGVGFGRALALTAFFALVNLLLLAGLLVFRGDPIYTILGLILEWLLLPVVVFRASLPVGWLRALGIGVVWNALKIVPAGLVVLGVWAFAGERDICPDGLRPIRLWGASSAAACRASRFSPESV
jgi:hypothetical protein